MWVGQVKGYMRKHVSMQDFQLLLWCDMSVMTSKIIGNSNVCATFFQSINQEKHQNYVSLAFVIREVIHMYRDAAWFQMMLPAIICIYIWDYMNSMIANDTDKKCWKNVDPVRCRKHVSPSLNMVSIYMQICVIIYTTKLASLKNKWHLICVMIKLFTLQLITSLMIC